MSYKKALTCLLCMVQILFTTGVFGQAEKALTADPGSDADQSINNSQFLLLNGIDQWVTIKGDRSKPVILFLHGGPGSTMSPYSDNLYKGWEKEFIIVQWDQRGAGKTYGCKRRKN